MTLQLADRSGSHFGMIRLRVRDSSGAAHTVSLAQHASLAELRARIEQLTTLQPASQQLLLGFPPKPLQPATDDQPLAACGIRSGDTLTVARRDDSPSQAASPPQPSSLPPLRVAAMADDNSCLFHAIDYCVSGRSADGAWRGVQLSAREMRQLVAAAVLSLDAAKSPPDTADSATASASDSAVSAYIASLPSVAQYAAAIERSEVWGGALECAVLSSALNCRIHAVDVESGVVHAFGSPPSAYACYLLYSGVHYDSLYRDAADGRAVAMFNATDTAVRDAALAAGAAAKRAGQYTSLSAFTLRCLDCGIAVRGQQEAQKHCKETTHSRFDEYRQ